MNKKLLLLSLLQPIANCFADVSLFYQQINISNDNEMAYLSIPQNLIGLSCNNNPTINFSKKNKPSNFSSWCKLSC